MLGYALLLLQVVVDGSHYIWDTPKVNNNLGYLVMGLDMYLIGDVFVRNREVEADIYIDGYPQDRAELELGYWRKHRKLHGYIVNTFAKGVDECQKIELWKSRDGRTGPFGQRRARSNF
jgi:hypothetical protein